jgi:hypothetical protein
MTTIPNMQSQVKQFSDAELARLTLDPHNIVYKHASASTVPTDQRMSGAEMKDIAMCIWDEFKNTFVEQMRLNERRLKDVAATDATIDTVTDSTIDATIDTVTDATIDTVTDATIDTVTDSTMDATIDTVTDATIDVVTDITEETTEAAPLSAKALISRVRHMLCRAHTDWSQIWKTQPRVFCKLTSPYTTQEEFEVLLQMYDIRIAEDDGVYSDKNITDNVLKQLLMSKLAKKGTFAEMGIGTPAPALDDTGGDTGADTGGDTGGDIGGDIGGDTGGDTGGDAGGDAGGGSGGDTGGDAGGGSDRSV